uniref:Uncharacterized protein n=1 Tax=Brassica oleracea TaxID=3712 RepID=A0A3P6E060_BRAOL|nr:unnamed protein product [Brassica oleracea]
MVAEIYRAIQTSDDYHSKRLDDIYYTFNNIISWLTIHTYEMKQDIVIIQKQHAHRKRSTIILGHRSTPALEHRSTIRLASFEDRLQSFTYRLDGVYYPLRDDIDSLTTHMNALQHEIYTIHRQLDFQLEPLPSIDRRTCPSIDIECLSLRGELVTEKAL